MTDRRASRPLRAAAALALGLAAATAPGAARAQFFGGWGGWDGGGWDGLAPQQVRRAIGQRGFRVLAPLRRNGDVFVADVLDERGRHERLIVAAADAQILQRFIVDDGRGPGAFPRGTDDDDRGLVPPADIPDAGRRLARPVEREAPPQRFGDLGAGDGDGTPGTVEPLHRPPPPIRIVKPRPRVVERTPDVAAPGREPGPVEAAPLAPAAPRSAAPPAPVAAVPPASPAATTKAPAAPPPAAAAPAPSATASRRLSDPLAIPGGDAGGKPVRSVATGVTGTPSAPPPQPAKAADVPVAPLD